ncbi:MAG: zf-TFIIB domain-containing protein [Pseudobacteriovorax sp.]|nr:zf-TFIIB domain-containing protein [Pseudobacteriovorax sp.]
MHHDKTSVWESFSKNKTPETRPIVDDSITYRPCPDCGKLMNRRQIVKGTGIVVDVCTEHGIWFDPGELDAALDYLCKSTAPLDHIAGNSSNKTEANGKPIEIVIQDSPNRRSRDKSLEDSGELILDILEEIFLFPLLLMVEGLLRRLS